MVVRRRWRRRSPVPQIVLTLEAGPSRPHPRSLDPAGFAPVDFPALDFAPRPVRAVEPDPVEKPGPPADLDLSGFDRLPPILGPARLSELQPGSDEWRW